jgi:peptidoglycan/xylan/chitin deacetylase (PgdA/CDA1 family)
MDRTRFHVNWSIDCEATQHSVNDADLGYRGASGYADILDAHGLKGTFFMIPGDAGSRPDFYRSLPKRGHEIGLHLHPGDEGYFEFAGVMGPDEQRELIATAKDRWAQAIGFAPVCFCMGYASANDYTYGVLEELGFRHGQVGLPGRRLVETASVWEGEPLHIHYANRWNRLLPGDLDFIDVPHTVDPESYMWGGKHPQDLRVELVDAKNHWYTSLKSVRRQLADDSLPVKVLRGVTHNTFDYTDPNNFRSQTLKGMIEGIGGILADAGCELVPATIETIAGDYRRVVPKADIKNLLTLDRRGYRGKKTV